MMNATMRDPKGKSIDISMRKSVPWVTMHHYADISTDVDFIMKLVTDGIFFSVHPWYIDNRFILS